VSIRKLVIWTGLVPIALVAAAFAGCGGDDDGGSGGSGSDESYVAAICKAGVEFSKALEEVFKDPSALTDEDKAIEKLSDAFEDFANAFAKAKPPADLKDWHEDAAKQLKDGAKQLKDGDLEGGIFAGDSPFPEPPAEVGERLSKIAETNKDCQEADFSFSD
jgi:hypothetical protein